MKNGKIVYLEITTWIGVSLGAMHFYGELVGYIDDEYTKVELKRKLTSAAVKELHEYGWSSVRAGDLFHGFDTRDDIRDEALATWQEHFPAALVLLEGRSAIGNPQKVLAGPEDFKTRVNQWYEEDKDLGGYEGEQEDRVDAIFYEYQKYLREYSE